MLTLHSYKYNTEKYAQLEDSSLLLLSHGITFIYEYV